jgi:hypothetical protein
MAVVMVVMVVVVVVVVVVEVVLDLAQVLAQETPVLAAQALLQELLALEAVCFPVVTP